MRNLILLALVAVFMLGLGCATPPPSSFTILDNPPKSEIAMDKSEIIVFYPENASVQSACYINVDGKRSGVIKQGTFTKLTVSPGTHIISMENDSHVEPRLVVNLSNEQTEYLEAGQTADVLMAKANLRLSDKKTAESQFPLLKYIQWDR